MKNLFYLLSIIILFSSCSDKVVLTEVENKGGILTHKDWVKKVNLPLGTKTVFVDTEYSCECSALTEDFIVIKAKKIDSRKEEYNNGNGNRGYYDIFIYSNGTYYFTIYKNTPLTVENFSYPSPAIFLVDKNKIYSHKDNSRPFVKKIKDHYSLPKL
jgi:hypothetical protein